ncbi:DUF262 domain-containing protein [Agrococcus sediminis]|uniref:DUF262 domain-containing protein n=1 Tax=Agrococcus sediminis TaxID=2599924 RepID=A0A5M8QMJ9_9MICO|nr:DUF262 domain-containing protein [Agrococcus sediminis]KAA6435956.1 DUF262 domain-containing protein [Agrococcus sediminis]
MCAFHPEDDGEVAISVAELVEQRSSPTDRWNLALVQRAEVWDELRMRHLLDSLLADYPIGAILLSSVAEPTRQVVVEAGGARFEEDAVAGSWQVLDGQQRINALFSVFTDRGHYGRFLLDMLMVRPAPQPAQIRRAKERAIPHIHHLSSADEELAQRASCIDLSNWFGWMTARGGVDLSELDATSVASLLRDLDPLFEGQLSPQEAETAADNLRRLLRAWKKRIPVLRARVDTPLDVLEVFTRINLGGVDVAGADVYFAGVKTFWPDAERRIDDFLSSVPVLRDRVSTLRFLSRLAARGLGQSDVLPMTVERLAGPKGALLREALTELAAPDDDVRAKLAAFVPWFTEKSELGYVLHEVGPELWEDVLAWVAASPDADEARFERNIEAIDAYLLGATLFQYRQVMGDTFRRLSFGEVLHAGSLGDDFPLEQIVAATRAKTELRGGRGRAVIGLGSEDERLTLASRHGRTLTALAQRIPYTSAPADTFDWDHIFPQGQAHRMWKPGKYGRALHHEHRHLVHSTGNFWALTSSANRSLKDMVGDEKFARLREWLDEGNGRQIWEEQRWSITPGEIANFVAVNEGLNDEPESINNAMELFRSTVHGRALRLLDEARRRFPAIDLFAADPLGAKRDPSPLLYDYRGALGLEVGDLDLHSVDRDEARHRLRHRAQRLFNLIAPRLGAERQLEDSWLWNSRGGGRLERAFACFALAGGNCIELMLQWESAGGVSVQIKAYPRRDRPGAVYPEFDHLPLARWADTDHEIVEQFMSEVERVEALHPRQ